MTGTGWFADVNNDDEEGPPGMWQPCLETGTGIIPSFDMWFKSREACEEYIRDTIIPTAGTFAD